MALKISNARELPTGAIRLDRNQAITYQENRISSWKKKSDTWFLRNGTYLLGASAAVSAATVFQFFRWRLRASKLWYSTYVPVAFSPSVTSVVLADKFLKEPLMIQEITCPVCAEMRAAFLQTSTAVVQSYALALLTSFAIASQTYSYPIPDFNIHKPAKFFRFVKKICLESKSRILPLFLLNVALSSLVTYQINKEVLLLNSTEDFLDQDDAR